MRYELIRWAQLYPDLAPDERMVLIAMCNSLDGYQDGLFHQRLEEFYDKDLPQILGSREDLDTRIKSLVEKQALLPLRWRTEDWFSSTMSPTPYYVNAGRPLVPDLHMVKRIWGAIPLDAANCQQHPSHRPGTKPAKQQPSPREVAAAWVQSISSQLTHAQYRVLVEFARWCDANYEAAPTLHSSDNAKGILDALGLSYSAYLQHISKLARKGLITKLSHGGGRKSRPSRPTRWRLNVSNDTDTEPPRS